jgi:hypothetical protein
LVKLAAKWQHTEEIRRALKSDFQERVGILFECQPQGDLFEPWPDRFTLILPNVDQRGEWLHLKLKSMLERPQRQFVLLATAADESRLPTCLGGHYAICRKKGAPRRSKPTNDR